MKRRGVGFPDTATGMAEGLRTLISGVKMLATLLVLAIVVIIVLVFLMVAGVPS